MDYFLITAFILFQASFLTQLYFILVYHYKLRVYKPVVQTEVFQGPVSVIICARNEEENLRVNLPAILEQDYREYEVVVVNDCSFDDSYLVLRDLSAKFPQLKVVEVAEHERYKHGKKFAVTLGIKAAINEVLVFTDADCKPSSKLWLRMMAANFKLETEIVLGYSPYNKYSGFLNMFIRFETFTTALNYLSFALAGDPYMGVGRNMAYRKSLFFRGKGFASHMHIPSGDDDLFVNQNANDGNTVIEIGEGSHVLSEPKRTFSEFLRQKIRHIGAGKAYKARHKKLLTLQSVSAMLFYMSMLTLILLKSPWWLIIPVFGIRLLVQLVVYVPILKRLGTTQLSWWFPLLDIIFYFYVFALNSISIFKKKVQWR